MRFPRSLWCFVVVCLLSTCGAYTLSVDDFGAAQGPVTGAGTSSYASHSSILGGERDVYLQFFPATSSFSVNNGSLRLTQTSGFTDVFVTYDGADANPANALGLGGVNLRNGGGNAFEIKILATQAADPHAHLWVRAYTTSSNFSEAHLVLNNGDFPSLVTIPFSSMLPNGTGADFSNIKTIELELAIGSGVNMDFSIDYIAVVPPPGPVVTLDFESLQHGDTGTTYFFYTYPEKGFVLADGRGVNGLGSFHTGNAHYAGSTMLFNNTESDTSLSREDGGDFDFTGIDLAPLQPQYPESGPIKFSGYRGNTLIVTETFNFNGNAGTQRFVPQNAFVQLTEVRWPQLPPRHQFDNLQVRENGPAGSGPQVEITRETSGLRAGLHHLQLEKNYALQISFDLTNWQYPYTFTAFTRAMDAGQVPNSAHGFYRLHWAQ